MYNWVVHLERLVLLSSNWYDYFSVKLHCHTDLITLVVMFLKIESCGMFFLADLVIFFKCKAIYRIWFYFDRDLLRKYCIAWSHLHTEKPHLLHCNDRTLNEIIYAPILFVLHSLGVHLD